MSSYVQKHLLPGETVLFATRLHWIIYWHVAALLTLFIPAMIKRHSTEAAITNKRIIVKRGLFDVVSLELNLSKVESVLVDQSILGRMLGYGDITVRGTGGTNEMFRSIARAQEFRAVFQQAANQ